MEIYEIIAVCMLGIAMILFTVKMLRDEKTTVAQWLVFAVTEAERRIGSGKGQEKLKIVYDMFIKRFPVVSFFISFETFSRWVDTALDAMRVLISFENKEKFKAVGEEINGEN